MLTRPTIDLTKLNMGRAYAFVGDLLTAGGMVPLGHTEGGIVATPTANYSTFTLPEQTGDVPLSVKVSGGAMRVTLPLIIGDAAAWAKVSPTGLKGGGRSGFKDVITTSLLIVPESELASDGTLSYSGTTPVWSPAEPKHALAVWKGYFEDVSRTFQFNEDGSKTVEEATFVGMFDDTAAADYKVWAQGSALTIGKPAIRI